MTLANWIHPLLFTGSREWSPLDLPNLWAWFDASQIVGLSDGDPVVTWEDLGPNGYDITQPVAGARPTYQTNELNGLPIVRFDGTDKLQRAAVPSPGGAVSCFVVALTTSFNIWKAMVLLEDAANQRNFQLLITNAAKANQGFSTAPAAWVNQATAVSFQPGSYHIVDGSYDGSTVLRAALDGVEASGSPGGVPQACSNYLVVGGSFYDGANSWVGDIPEVIVCGALISDANKALVRSYLLNKYAGAYWYYLVYDTFTDINGTDLDAHVPEQGSWTEVDTGGLCDIQSNKAQITGAGVYTDPLFYAGPFDRVAGQEFVFTIKPGQLNQQMAIALWSGLNFDPATGNKEHLMWFFSDGNIYCREAVEPAAVAYTTDEVECKIVLKAVGAEYWYNGVKVADLAVNNGSPLYIGVAAKGGTWDFDFMSYDRPSV